jgi:CRP/FNR family cyclic AMP-dependent transcriptional regulator
LPPVTISPAPKTRRGNEPKVPRTTAQPTNRLRLQEAECKELLRLLANTGVRAAVRRYVRGQSVLDDGSANALYILTEGAIKAARYLPRGKLDLQLLGPWDAFGRMTPAGEPLLPDGAVAVTETEIVKIPGIFLKRAAKMQPEIALRIATLQEIKTLEYEERATRLLARSTQTRLADLLLWLNRKFGDAEQRIPLRLTHEELAAMIGCTRESVNEAMLGLRRRGLVSIERGRIQLLEPTALADLRNT